MNKKHFKSGRMNALVTVKEYGLLCKNPAGSQLGCAWISEEAFDRLERLVLESYRAGKDTDALELMTVSSRKGIGKVICAKNYVGIMAMPDGTQIEILPKLYNREDESSVAKTQSIFIHMLKVIKDIPNKPFSQTGLGSDKSHLLEIFIRMFIAEAAGLVKRGLKSDYRQHRDNEFVYKGKLQVAQHIKYNAAHKERFYMEFDEFSLNRPENRLMKMTIEWLMRISSNANNRKELYRLLALFDQIESSIDPDQDWASVSIDRSMRDYETIMKWCRLFLSGQSFTPFKGDFQAYALLFPMEKVYERYVATLLKKGLSHLQVQVKTQDRTYQLFHKPARFHLKPDIVVQWRNGVVVLDTKWKLLSSRPDYGISQSDMYQAYAYGKKYEASHVYLLYPWIPTASEIDQPVVFESGDGVKVKIIFLDLNQGELCIRALSEELISMIEV